MSQPLVRHPRAGGNLVKQGLTSLFGLGPRLRRDDEPVVDLKVIDEEKVIYTL